MRKKIKIKKANKKKRILQAFLIIVLIYISFSYTFYYLLKNNKLVNNSSFIKFIVKNGNTNIFNDYKIVDVVNNTIKFISSVDLSKPNTILNTSILKFGKKSDEISLEHNDDYSNLEELKKISSYIEDPYNIDISKPLIYIYNTHQLENYNNHNLSIYNITPNVLMASYILKEKLNKLGVATIVEDTNLTEFLNINNWNYASSYKATRLLLLEKISKYDTLKYFIDFHRDSVGKDSTTVTIDGKNYAKVLFVIGLEHENYQKNLEVTTKLNNMIKEKYPSLTKGILKKQGSGVDGIYNQDISPNCILIEVGGVDNTIEEVYNTIEILANILVSFVGDNDG